MYDCKCFSNEGALILLPMDSLCSEYGSNSHIASIINLSCDRLSGIARVSSSCDMTDCIIGCEKQKLGSYTEPRPDNPKV